LRTSDKITATARHQLAVQKCHELAALNAIIKKT
jgi:hypothetical protein